MLRHRLHRRRFEDVHFVFRSSDVQCDKTRIDFVRLVAVLRGDRQRAVGLFLSRTRRKYATAVKNLLKGFRSCTTVPVQAIESESQFASSTRHRDLFAWPPHATTERAAAGREPAAHTGRDLTHKSLRWMYTAVSDAADPSEIKAFGKRARATTAYVVIHLPLPFRCEERRVGFAVRGRPARRIPGADGNPVPDVRVEPDVGVRRGLAVELRRLSRRRQRRFPRGAADRRVDEQDRGERRDRPVRLITDKARFTLGRLSCKRCRVYGNREQKRMKHFVLYRQMSCKR